MNRLFAQIAAGAVGIWLALEFVPQVSLSPAASERKILYIILIGMVIGLISFFIKPVLNLITLPLRILSLGLFTFILDMGVIWATDIIFRSLIIAGIIPLFWTTLIILALSIILPRIKFSRH